mgnify:FL=1
MKETRWHWTAISLVAGGALLACGCTLWMARSLGPLQWGVYLGCLLILAGLFWFRRRMTNQESELEELRHQVSGQRKQQQEQQKEFEQARLEVQAELEKQAAEIDRRQQKLTSQLANWYEWL